MDQDVKAILIIVSHAHAPPLNPPPTLNYDLRRIKNPPKTIRTTHDGTSKRLRDHMLAQEGFVALLDEAEQEIRDSMKSAIRKHAKAAMTAEEPPVSAAEASRSTATATVTAPAPRDSDDSDEDADGEGEGEDDDVPLPADRPALRVGVSCAKGRHRSVAFVEELSARKWPAEWQVRIRHRDLEKPKPRLDKERWRKDARAPRFKSFAVDSENE